MSDLCDQARSQPCGGQDCGAAGLGEGMWGVERNHCETLLNNMLLILIKMQRWTFTTHCLSTSATGHFDVSAHRSSVSQPAEFVKEAEEQQKFFREPALAHKLRAQVFSSSAEEGNNDRQEPAVI